MSGVCWQIAGLLGEFAGIYWLKKINYFKTNENQALVGLLGGDVKNAPNKQFKRDSQRLAFLLLLQIECLWHNALGLGRGVVHPLIGRYAT
ncbi:hypothetical protein QNE95_004367 [Vibrio vulnificus]|uniref:hypothetical protein n=2 Tax=Vibrio vulnificus TaxID=672 RepID=UPI0005444256|nr:hypothetical protein [Vibrio vulnificus]EHD2237120.1 hypothetical protein [Vibrio vulnificus]EHT4877748.1 hypothetical protein [Vibrio vulnificus]EHV9838515.1 hypothetical protein [Vibrio vulnificus]EHZ2497670.1 hypothetical protein [Vibrio vulnificus]EIA0806948.1 hypothetical protein [Vibrio vulnificus]